MKGGLIETVVDCALTFCVTGSSAHGTTAPKNVVLNCLVVLLEDRQVSVADVVHNRVRESANKSAASAASPDYVRFQADWITH